MLVYGGHLCYNGSNKVTLQLKRGIGMTPEQKAREVIDKNISTVQQIACLLGEHMVQTETILNTIAHEYTSDEE